MRLQGVKYKESKNIPTVSAGYLVIKDNRDIMFERAGDMFIDTVVTAASGALFLILLFMMGGGAINGAIAGIVAIGFFWGTNQIIGKVMAVKEVFTMRSANITDAKFIPKGGGKKRSLVLVTNRDYLFPLNSTVTDEEVLQFVEEVKGAIQG